MMGFFRAGSGSRLVKNSSAAAEQEDAAIPVVTDTVEEDVSTAFAQQNRNRQGLKSTLVSKRNLRGINLFDPAGGNTTLG